MEKQQLSGAHIPVSQQAYLMHKALLDDLKDTEWVTSVR